MSTQQNHRINYMLWYSNRNNFFNYDNELNRLENKFNVTIKKFKSPNEIFDLITNIYFKNTYIIILDTNNLFDKFYNIFKSKMKDILIIPKFIIYSPEGKKYYGKYPEYYTCGNINSSINDIIKSIKMFETIPQELTYKKYLKKLAHKKNRKKLPQIEKVKTAKISFNIIDIVDIVTKEQLA